MNDLLETIENVGVLARQEPAPSIDVSLRVISRLRQYDTGDAVWWPLALFAGGTVAAAGVAFFAGLPLIELFVDPWSAYMASSLGPFI